MNKIKQWLAAHPWWNGLFVAVESAIVGFLTTALNAYLTDTHVLSRAGIKRGLVTCAGMVAMSVRNYLKRSPIAPKA
jgi:hypothetical protein